MLIGEKKKVFLPGHNFIFIMMSWEEHLSDSCSKWMLTGGMTLPMKHIGPLLNAGKQV